MKHIFFIDPIEKLNTKKDSTMLMALTAKQKGLEAYFLFEEDFYVTNNSGVFLNVYEFEGDVNSSFYVENLKITSDAKILALDAQTVLHMRIDPPYDSRYQRYLWMLDFLKAKGIQVKNNPIGIMKHNEKLEAYKRENSLASFVGQSLDGATKFVSALMKSGVSELILKPLDLYQGIGVQKVEASNFKEAFLAKVKEYAGPVVIQPFEAKVKEGEVRAIFYKSIELGSILKTPKEGEFLANIAQGAKYKKIDLIQNVSDECTKICKELEEDGIDLVAFDILGDKISEVNVTCPGLLVEVSSAHQRNLALDIF